MTGEENKAEASEASSPQLAELTAQLSTVSLGLPSFWPDNPDAWFVNVESQFRIASITRDETKFHKVVAKLPEDIAVKVLSISQQYTTDGYSKLKSAILKLFTKPKSQRFDELLAYTNISNTKPSAILSQLQNLTDAVNPADRIKMDDDDLKEIFIRAIPQNIQGSIRIIKNDHSITELAEKADLFYETNLRQRASVAAVINPTTEQGNQNTESSQLSAFRDEIAALRRAIERSHNRNTPPNQPRASQPHRNAGNLCFYHQRFGSRARKCTGVQSGCSMATGN